MQDDSQMTDGDPVVTALTRVAAVAEREAQVQARVAAAAREAVSERDPGDTGEKLGKRVRDVLDQVAGSTERLIGGAAELRRAWAAQLARQGLSRREIAARLGVTRQRASVLLGGNGTASGDRP